MKCLTACVRSGLLFSSLAWELSQKELKTFEIISASNVVICRRVELPSFGVEGNTAPSERTANEAVAWNGFLGEGTKAEGRRVELG